MDIAEETEQAIRDDLKEYGTITSLSVNAARRSAIVRFRDIASAEKLYDRSKEQDEDTG